MNANCHGNEQESKFMEKLEKLTNALFKKLPITTAVDSQRNGRT